MFINDDFVFLHLQKAAGTFVADRLSQRLPGTIRDGHTCLHEGKRGRIVAAAIRDPWDWYVSLWAYGCMGEGGLRGRLTSSQHQVRRRVLGDVLSGRMRPKDAIAHLRRDNDRDPAAWCDLYASAEDADRFRTWLRAILNLPAACYLPEGYPDLPMCGRVGFMTFRVLRLFTDWAAWKAGALTVRTPDDALAFYYRHGIVDHILKTERIAEDLERLLAKLDRSEKFEAPAAPAKSNRSRRRPHMDYYDPDTFALVQEKDRMVIEAFGYAPSECAR
ncbi:hypothetical protein LY56_01314 [Roseinatronobacter thiooxidans]|uniref:Sulfotransferase family protein n=1 Tax=Roseinatronobacter thiooxidans TaxID=121821 RepID=A0A2W7QAS6_9RHOB|nr:hypothetical protein [Roseinatronobacter thiooxidans]PZX45754.1 hypothetical protein LY56_01314 [Roseinatronobacter thiooxidans]